MANTLERAMAYLNTLPVAVSGSGGHNATLRAACECFRFGLTPGEAWQVLQWFNEYRCQPKWREHELRHKLADAEKIVRGAGQVAKHVGPRRYSAHRRIFAPPAEPVRKPRPAPVVPVRQRTEEEENAWWAEQAEEIGLTLDDFDALVGNEPQEAQP